jgi:cytochrome c oxidase subunit 2
VRRIASIAALFLGVLAFAAPALADNAGFTPVEPHSPQTERINENFYAVAAVCGFVLIAVEATLIFFVLRYRRRNRPPDAEGPQIHGNTRLELLWTGVPVLLLALIVAYTFYKLPGIDDPPKAAAANALRVEVEGRQFYWLYKYPDGTITYDTLIVPVGRVVEVDVTAPDFDVIHSWWIPALAGKRDAIPGRVNHTWFQAEGEGEYGGNCTEFCGLQHNAMVATVRAVPADRWEAELRAFTENQGQQIFEAACAKCHNLEGPQLIGPTLQGNATLADPEALRQLLETGRGRMPPVGRGWTDQQFDALIEYTKQFGGAGGG